MTCCLLPGDATGQPTRVARPPLTFRHKKRALEMTTRILAPALALAALALAACGGSGGQLAAPAPSRV